jgi:hypothetical protein
VIMPKPLSIQDVMDRCKCGVYLRVNEHKDHYETAAEYLENEGERHKGPIATPEVILKMIDLDVVIELQFYPRNPIGSHTVYHYDLQGVMIEALRVLDEIGADG